MRTMLMRRGDIPREVRTETATASDEELVERARADLNAYRHVVDRYAPRLIRYVRRFAGIDVMTAEDVVQEVFFKAYRNLNDFDLRLKFSSWIYRIAHNEAVSHLRKRAARPKTVTFAETDDNTRPFEDAFVAELNVEAEVAAKLDGEQLGKIVAELDPKYREVIILRYFEDKDYGQISDILKKPPGTVATLLSRAKAHLRERLAGERSRYLS